MSWRSGWFLDCAPKSYVCLSTGGGDAHGGYYFEVTLDYLGTGGHATYDFTGAQIAAGLAGEDAPLRSVIAHGDNVLSTPTKSIMAVWPGIPAGYGLFNESGVQGKTIAFAVNTGTKLVWTKNLTDNIGWNNGAGGTPDPATGVGGTSYASAFSTSAHLMCGIVSAEGAMPAPPAPTLTSVAQVSAPGGTFFVRTAYANASGGSLASKVSSLTVTAGNSVKVTSPAAPSYDGGAAVAGYAVYAGTSADDCELQNTGGTATAIGTDFTLANALVTGAATAPYAKATLNVGGSAFTGTLPSGFVAWGASDTLNSADCAPSILLSGGNLVWSSEGASISGLLGFYIDIARSVSKKAA